MAAEVYVGTTRHKELGHCEEAPEGEREIQIVPLSSFVGNRAMCILRPKDPAHAKAIAAAMVVAYNNRNIRYSRENRLDIVRNGVYTDKLSGCDCSSLTRACIENGIQTGLTDFNTKSEKHVLESSGLFEKARLFMIGTQVYEGDVLVTRVKGYTGICVQGLARVVRR